MTRKAIYYSKFIQDQGITPEEIFKVAELFELVPEMARDFADPTVQIAHKHDVIDRAFPENFRNVLKLMCDNNDFDLFADIVNDYKSQGKKGKTNAGAVIYYVTMPSDEEIKKLKAFAAEKCGTDDIYISLKQSDEIVGGVIIEIGDKQYDFSLKNRMDQMKKQLTKTVKSLGSTEEIIALLKADIDDAMFSGNEHEIGTVKSVGDGIVTVTGIDHAVYGEIVIFDSGVKGMVQDIRMDQIGCVLFGSDREIKEGSRLTRTGKRAGIPVSDAYLGRVTDALGKTIDGKGEINTSEYRPIECEAPGIIDRQPVSVPMETGILAIDSMFPIGRGQRELIIGDRQTGKTSIAIDTIINQKDKGVICIYVAIGQKASTVAHVVHTLEVKGAMPYSIVIASSASDPAPLQYIAPYAGTAMAEHFMHAGKDVLIVYDDLSKHAVAYRALSLLLERSPGREAYPGDVFYLHSRLLERSSKLSDALGGGSITALPIIETQAGDVSAYIPTNVISITDGQIFLESNLFFSGQRPAVNVGLSVSRVGSAAQSKAMKKASGSLRVELAQFREMEVFSQFASDLDDATKAQLAYGKSLMEILKQPLYNPLSMPEQVIILIAVTKKAMTDVPFDQIKSFQKGFLEFVHNTHPEIINMIEYSRKLEDLDIENIISAVNEYKESIKR